MQPIIDELSQYFPNASFEIREASIGPAVPIFIVRIDTAAYLEKSWQQISSTIAGLYQASLDESKNFERWNIYVFFLLTSEVDRQLQGVIEQDKFAARKIVVPRYTESTSIDDLIARFITGTELLSRLKPYDPTKDRNSTDEMGSGNRDVSELFHDPASSELKKLIGKARFVERTAHNRKDLEALLNRIETDFFKKVLK